MIAVYILGALIFYAAVCIVYNIYSESEIAFPKRIFLSEKTAITAAAIGAVLSSAALYISRNDIPMYSQVFYWIVLIILSDIAIIDLKRKIIPNKFVLSLLGCWAVYVVFIMIYDLGAAIEIALTSLSGMVFALIVFGAGYLLMKSKLGGGDVKLMIVLGFVFTGKAVFGVIMYSLIFSLLFALGAVISGKMKMKDSIPFAPFILLGSIAAVALY